MLALSFEICGFRNRLIGRMQGVLVLGVGFAWSRDYLWECGAGKSVNVRVDVRGSGRLR